MTVLSLLVTWFLLGLGVAALLHLTKWPDLDDEPRSRVVRQNRGRP